MLLGYRIGFQLSRVRCEYRHFADQLLLWDGVAAQKSNFNLSADHRRFVKHECKEKKTSRGCVSCGGFMKQLANKV